ncbi:polysaccharide biosynthesis protein [Streptococcus sp. X16XC17]|uniref:putative polysaccharide biosynthesis protein n=1 Tax=unclassified Streptococcus TaxID=2608887 RepID=UPI00066FEC1D|nr:MULTISPECIES: polysaccharide biosynthesis protein [unclassified Streptococcus]TCD46063.1 polysaccharide biosynthesis protein [Streptococcus sp. X16XC17]
MSEKPVQTHEQETMARGMAWLTAGNFISRLLGVIYIIPWYIWLGKHSEEANALFNMGYQVYANFLLISTVGLPTAVAKQIAKYNTLGREDISYYLLREFLKLMLALGAVFAGVMYVSSPFLAEWSGSKELLIPVMYSLVPPLFIFPAMSIMRGFFQGHNDLKPYAISQIAEQVIRVIWILLATFYIMKFGSGNYHEAVIQSTFAAFIGMIASVAVLLYVLQRRGLISKIYHSKAPETGIELKPLIVETVKEAIPLIILGCAFQVFQFIDQMTFVNVMKMITGQARKELLVWYTYMTANPSKITMLIIGITGSIGSVAIPLITARFVEKNRKATSNLVTDNMQMLFIFVIPAIIGTILVARPLYSIFYGWAEDLAIDLFIANILLIFVQGLYAVLGVIIQAIFENRRAILYFLIGLVTKIVLQIPFLYLFQVYGSLLSSAIGLSITVILFYRHIDKVLDLNKKKIGRDLVGISLVSLVMGIIVFTLEWGLTQWIPPVSRFISILHIIISGSVGILIFGVLTLKTRQLDKLIGARAQRLRKKLRIS